MHLLYFLVVADVCLCVLVGRSLFSIGSHECRVVIGIDTLAEVGIGKY